MERQRIRQLAVNEAQAHESTRGRRRNNRRSRATPYMRMTSGGHPPRRPPQEQLPPAYSQCEPVSEDEANWDDTCTTFMVMVNSEEDVTSNILSRKEIMLRSSMPTALGHFGYDPMPRLSLRYLYPSGRKSPYRSRYRSSPIMTSSLSIMAQSLRDLMPYSFLLFLLSFDCIEV
jgi:hypothetical protein